MTWRDRKAEMSYLDHVSRVVSIVLLLVVIFFLYRCANFLDETPPPPCVTRDV